MSDQGETTTTKPSSRATDETLGGILKMVGGVVVILTAIFWVVMFNEMNDSGFGATEYSAVQKWSMTVSCLVSLSLGCGLIGLGQIVKRD